MGLYPDTFKTDNKKHFQSWVDRYKNAIPENWNFDKLMWYFDTQYKSTVIPPHPSFFFAYKEDVRPRKDYQPQKTLSKEEQKQSQEAYKEFKKRLNEMIFKKAINS